MERNIKSIMDNLFEQKRKEADFKIFEATKRFRFEDMPVVDLQSGSIEKIYKCIKSCETLEQLNTLRKPIIRVWDMVKDEISFYPFIVIDLQDFFNAKSKRILLEIAIQSTIAKHQVTP